MKYIIVKYVILLLVLFLSYCRVKQEKTLVPPNNYELIQGDWVAKKYPKESFSHHFKHFHLNIEDSIFTLFSEYSDSVKFSIAEDKITVFDSTHNFYLGNIQEYKIVNIDSNKLILLAHSDKIKNRLRELNWKSDTLSFFKRQKRNNLKPLTIGFSSLGCYGPCPSMKLEVDNNMHINFFGGVYSDLEEGYSGKIDKSIYNSIIRQIQYLHLDSLKSEYIASWTDDQTRYLVIETKDTIIKTKAYGIDKQPVELIILMDNLMNLYKRVHMKKNESINDSTSFNNFLKISRPIEPPIPIKTEER